MMYGFGQSRQILLKLNMFERSTILFEMHHKLWATRIYLILLIAISFILTIYSSATTHRISVSVHNPTRDQFESMYTEYSETLSCPCNQLSVPYASIISIEPIFHQVCSSDFIRNDRWLLYFDMIPYNGTASTFVLYGLDFRSNPGSSFFYSLQALCKFAMSTVSDALSVFNDVQLVSSEPLSTENFQEQTKELIGQFKQQVRLCLYLVLA